MELELNKKYKFEEIVLNYANQKNFSVILTYSAYFPGEVSELSHVKFFVYDNFQNFCCEFVQECIEAIEPGDFENYEIPNCSRNNEITIMVGGCKAVCVKNLPKEKISVENYEEQICKIINECFDEKNNEIKKINKSEIIKIIENICKNTL